MDIYGEKVILSALEDGECSKAVDRYRSGALAGDTLAELDAGLQQIWQSEAYQNFGVPPMIPFIDLKNSKTFLELFGLRR